MFDLPGFSPPRRPGGRLFSVRVADDGDGAVLWLAGELDFTVGAALGDALSGIRVAPGLSLTVDVSQLGFLDVSGLRRLVEADDRLLGAGGAGLVVRGATGIVHRIFEVMQATSLLESSAAVPRQAGRLDRARQTAGLSVTELYVAYFALGGTAELGEVADYLAGNADALDVHQQALAVQAVNEQLLDLGRADRLISFDRGEKDRGLEWT